MGGGIAFGAGVVTRGAGDFGGKLVRLVLPAVRVEEADSYGVHGLLGPPYVGFSLIAFTSGPHDNGAWALRTVSRLALPPGGHGYAVEAGFRSRGTYKKPSLFPGLAIRRRDVLRR